MQDSLFFIGVFVFVFIVWLVTGGPTRPLSMSGPLLPAPGALGGGNYITLPKVTPLHGGPSVSGSSATTGGTNSTLKTISSKLSQTNSQVNQLTKEVNQVVAFGSPSPYRGQVKLSHSVSGAGGTKVQSEYIQLTASSGIAPVSISGWTIESEVSNVRATIPLGTEVPRSGIVNAIEPVVLQAGDRATISTGRSPIGASFRENKCIGYFAQFQSFSPGLPNSCPTPSSELTARYGPDLVRDPNCIDYVSHLSRCSIPPNTMVKLTSACQQFVTTNLNYNGCVTAHSSDIDFKSKNWRIYLGRDASMWRKTHEVIKLLDASGKTVDMFSY